MDAETLIAEALEAHHNSESTAYLKVGYLQTMLATIWMRLAINSRTQKQSCASTLELFTRRMCRPTTSTLHPPSTTWVKRCSRRRKYGEAETVLTDPDPA